MVDTTEMVILGLIVCVFCSSSSCGALYVSNVACNVFSSGTLMCPNYSTPGPSGPAGSPGQDGSVIQTVTLNNQPFDPAGYSVTQGEFPTVSGSGTPGSNPQTCYNSCSADPTCMGWQLTSTGVCNKMVGVGDITGNETGILLTAANYGDYAAPLVTFLDSAISVPAKTDFMNPGMCLSNCTATPGCVAWTHRNSAAATSKNTCVTYKNTPGTAYSNVGFMAR